jgi:hypothetical protein
MYFHTYISYPECEIKIIGGDRNKLNSGLYFKKDVIYYLLTLSLFLFEKLIVARLIKNIPPLRNANPNVLESPHHILAVGKMNTIHVLH